jgi:tetratricopeptide (TPR) repeat protein
MVASRQLRPAFLAFLTLAALLASPVAGQTVTEWMDRADAARESGDFAGSIAIYTRAIAAHPKEFWLHNDRGITRQRAGDAAGALADYNRAIELRPDSAIVLTNRGTVRRANGDIAGALADMNRAVAVNSKYFTALGGLGVTYTIAGDWARAATYFQRAIEAAPPPEKSYLHFYLWVARMRLNRQDEAQRELAAYFDTPDLRVKPREVHIADFLLRRSTEEALLRVAASPDAETQRGLHCEAWYYMGVNQLLAGNRAAAAEAFRKSLATNHFVFVEFEMARAELKALEGGTAR